MGGKNIDHLESLKQIGATLSSKKRLGQLFYNILHHII